MANRGDLTVALKLQADVAEGLRRLGQVESALDRIEATDAGAAGAGLNTLASAAGTAARASSTAATAQQQLDNATARATRTVQSATISAKQHAQAMRMLPMQITDVVTSISSGMPIWMVAIQQGGQIRDSFGGIGPAFRAVAAAVSPVVVGIGAVAAVAGALVTAYAQGSAESARLANALVLTGNYAGTTYGQMNMLAESISDVTGTQRQAAAALEALAASGKVAGDQMGEIGTAAVAMSNAAGRAIGEIVAEFVKLGEEPTKASAALNEQYHYLTASVYEQIRALEEQGEKTEAARLAQDAYADAVTTRAAEVERNLGSLQQAWNAVRLNAGKAWSAMLNIGREDSLEEQLQKARERASGARPTWFTSQQDLDSDVKVLEAAVEAQRKRAADEGARQQAEAAGVKAIDAVTRANDSAASAQTKMNKALDDYRANLEKIRAVNPNSALLDPKLITETEAGIRKKFTPKTRTKADPVDTAYQSQLQALTLARADAEQRLQNTKDGVAATDEKAMTRLEAWLSVNRNALKLDDDRVVALKRLAEQTDIATEAAAKLADEKKREERITAGMADVDTRMQALSGNPAAAAIAEVEERWRKLRKDLADAGDQGGLIKVEQLVDLEKAKARFDELQREIDKVLGGQTRDEQSIEAQQQAGLLTELEARERILDVHRRTYEQLQQLRPVLEVLSQQPGALGEQAAAALQQLDTQATRLQATTSLLQSTLQEGLASGLREALTGLAEGTMTLREAVHALATSVADSLLDMATQQLAQQAAKGLMSLLPGAGGGADMTSGAAAVSASAVALSGAGGSLLAGAAAIEAAAVSLAAANGVSTASKAAGGTGGGSGTGWIGAVLSLFGFSDGGYTGAGGKHQPAGVVHAGEFVTRQEVTHQPGAIDFLNDFNQRGMQAVFGWRGYADGGLVTAPAITAPAIAPAGYQPATPAAAGSSKAPGVRIVNVVDPELAGEYMNSAAGEQSVLNVLRNNAGAIKQILS